MSCVGRVSVARPPHPTHTVDSLTSGSHAAALCLRFSEKHSALLSGAALDVGTAGAPGGSVG